MKTKIFITAGCLILAIFASGQNKQSDKEEKKTMNVEESIQSGSYEIVVNQANPINGMIWHLTSYYSIRILGDSSYVYLPYFGRVYTAFPYDGDGGIKVNNLMDSYNVDFKKEKEYSINFTAKGTHDIYRFSMSVWKNGNASINVTCNNRQAISYLGELILSEK